jgi:hypothetical protein
MFGLLLAKALGFPNELSVTPFLALLLLITS